jgi:3-phenylpropionate/trans-cinnamate dioxygenase ferredoxin subunit
MSEVWHRVLAAADVPEGRMRGAVVDGRDVVVVHSKDGWFALDNICSHAYAKLDEGRLRGCRLICPLHGASFDVRDGSVLGAPATVPIRTHRLRLTGDYVEVALSA